MLKYTLPHSVRVSAKYSLDKHGLEFIEPETPPQLSSIKPNNRETKSNNDDKDGLSSSLLTEKQKNIVTPLYSLEKYLDTPKATSFSYNKRKKCFGYFPASYSSKKIYRGGVHRWIKRNALPKHYKEIRRRRATQKKGSTRKIGSRVDDELTWVWKTSLLKTEAAKKRRRNKKKLHRFTTKILSYFEQNGHTIVHTQTPAFLPKLKKATQADVLTKDLDGKLYGWEVKTGWPPGGYRSQYFLNRRVVGAQKVSATKFNQWEIQRFLTFEALKKGGVKLHSSNVLHVWSQDAYSSSNKRKTFSNPSSSSSTTTVELAVRGPTSWSKCLYKFI